MSEAVGLKELLRRKIKESSDEADRRRAARAALETKYAEGGVVRGGTDEFRLVADKFEVRDHTGRVHLSSDDLHAPGAKDDKAKPIAGELVLGFPRALEALVAVATYGANKYSRGGYLHVNNFDVRYLDAAMRHLLSYGRGDKTDKESGLPHLAHCLWNIAAILEMETRHEESSGS